MLAFFYEIWMPFSKSASKTLSHIQSTAKYIFLRALYYEKYFKGTKYNWSICLQIKRINPEKVCYLEYDKLYVDHKIYVWNETLGQVIEHAEAERYGYGGMNDFMMSRPGTQMMNMNSRPPSQMSMGGMHPKSASSIPRLPPLARAVSLATGMAQMDPRDEKLGELERIINNYQEKLDAVTTNYQVWQM